MILAQVFRSPAKLVEDVLSTNSRAVSFIITKPAQGEADQPFCGAEISTSTPSLRMSTQMQPEAMQSSTNTPPTA